MKNYFIPLLLILLFSCKKNSQTVSANKPADNISANSNSSENSEAIHTIKDFYLTFYGSENPSADENIKKKYLAERVLRRIHELTADGENLILDYDPFINGQDYNSEVLQKTLEVIPLENTNEFRASFLLFGGKGEKRTNIDLLLVKENGNFLISSILNNEFLNFKNETRKAQTDKRENISLKAIGEDLKITNNNDEIILKKVIMDGMSLSTSFNTINDKDFFLMYENSASQVKTVEIYILSYSEDKLKLLSKEVVKFGEPGIDDKLFLYDKKYLDGTFSYAKLTALDDKNDDSFSKDPVKKTIFKNSEKIEVKEFKNISPEDYFIQKTTFAGK